MRSFWVIQVGPKPNDECPSKGEARRLHRQKRRRNVTQEAGIGVMWP